MALNPQSLVPGEEQYEMFTRRMGRKTTRLYQYDYRDNSGKLFSCVAASLDAARAKRDQWLSER